MRETWDRAAVSDVHMVADMGMAVENTWGCDWSVGETGKVGGNHEGDDHDGAGLM